MERSEAPAIGTTEAAVRSCVSLMAAVFGQSEDLIAYWLDLYFQVRSAYEREARHEEPVMRNLIRIEDLYPLLRDMFTRELRSALGEDGGTPRKGRKRAAKAAGTEDAGIPYEKPQVITAQEAAEAETRKRTEPGPWTVKKRRISERLKIARDTGVTVAQIVKASEGRIGEGSVLTAINAGKLDQKTWTELGKALDRIGCDPIVTQGEG